jgi:hypothetical protein
MISGVETRFINARLRPPRLGLRLELVGLPRVRARRLLRLVWLLRVLLGLRVLLRLRQYFRTAKSAKLALRRVSLPAILALDRVGHPK